MSLLRSPRDLHDWSSQVLPSRSRQGGSTSIGVEVLVDCKHKKVDSSLKVWLLEEFWLLLVGGGLLLLLLLSFLLGF